jgi:hypothetical protein
MNELGPEGRKRVAPRVSVGKDVAKHTAPEARKIPAGKILRPYGAARLVIPNPGLTAGATLSRPSGPNSFTGSKAGGYRNAAACAAFTNPSIE